MLTVLLLGWAAPARARVHHLCPEGRALTGARQMLLQMDARIWALSDKASLEQANASLARLLQHPCLQIAGEHEGLRLPAQSALSLQTWWSEGGREWLQSYLSPSLPGESRRVVVPPDLRTSLWDQAPPRATRGGWVCSPRAASCEGQAPEAWLVEAEAAFGERAAVPDWHAQAAAAQMPDGGAPAGRSPAMACAAAAAGARDREGYALWHACLERGRSVLPHLPLGRFRAPDRGWLLLWGRRGHYHFCDEVRAYDLASGSAHLATDCSALQLHPDGQVDFGATDRKRTRTVKRGRVEAEALRRAVLFALLSPWVETVAIAPVRAPLPVGLSVAWDDEHQGGELSHTFSFSTDQTQLDWAWVEGGEVLQRGTLTWPGSSTPGEDHAVRLLQRAEETFQPGEPLSPFPRALAQRVLAQGPPPVSGRDAQSATLGSVEAELLEALATAPDAGTAGPGR